MESKLKFIKEVERKHNKRYGLYQCECGKTKEIYMYHVEHNKVFSCGCIQRAITSKHFTTHGLSKTPEYYVWKEMKARCYNENNQYYFNYGGRGITVCDRWLESFKNFIEDMKNRPDKTYSIDRINNSKGYYKENCKWSLKSEQENNKRNNRILVLNGRKQNLQQWANELNMDDKVLRTRLRRGWSDEEILTTPIKEKGIFNVIVENSTNKWKR